MGVKNAEKSVKFVREKRFTPVKKNKNRVKNGVHAQIGGSRTKKKHWSSCKIVFKIQRISLYFICADRQTDRQTHRDKIG